MLNLQKHFAEEQETHDFLASCLEHRAEVEDFLSSLEKMKKGYKGGGGSGGSSTIVIKVEGAGNCLICLQGAINERHSKTRAEFSLKSEF